MSARAGMVEIIAELRALGAAGTADFSIAGISYFTDDQLQDILDQHRRDWTHIPLIAQSTQTNGTTYYYDYFIPPELGKTWEREEIGRAHV